MRTPRLNDHKQSQNYTTLDVRQAYHTGDDRARRSFNSNHLPVSLQLLKVFLKTPKTPKSVAIGIAQVPVNNNNKLLDGDLLLLYSNTERPPRMVTLGTDPFDSFDP